MSPGQRRVGRPYSLLLAQISSPKVRAFVQQGRPRGALVGMQSHFLDERLASAKELSTGDVPKRIEAFDTASQLAAHFRTTAQGKEAVKIAASLNADAAFRKELSARNQYNLAMNKSGGDDVKLAKLLRAVSVHFGDTYYVASKPKRIATRRRRPSRRSGER